ncbi:MAG: carboxylating nicotinate-nucleotide diphosphorylase [Candidatus Methylomirabilales bacterium]
MHEPVQLCITPSLLEAADRLIDQDLAEDVGPGDITTEALVPSEATGRARIEARAPVVVAGLFAALRVFTRLDDRVHTLERVAEGAGVEPGGVVARLAGPVRALLTGERLALNLLCRLSGVATLTRQYVEALRGCPARLLDTRKTTPGLRALEKFAVRAGGGHNHRIGLFDGILVKDNHIAACGGVAPAVRRLRALQHLPNLKIEVECKTLPEVIEAIEAGADILLLDNMDLGTLRQAVTLVRHRVPTEASGGITLDNIRAVAQTGVDFISVGALTHSAPAANLSMEMESE